MITCVIFLRELFKRILKINGLLKFIKLIICRIVEEELYKIVNIIVQRTHNRLNP